MKKILFVDDDPNIIEALQRMLRPLRSEWDMQFTTSGKEALKLIEQSVPDVIVSDMRMPEMDGAELLTIVMKKYPKMIRIILSGYSEQELILKSVRPTHQFLSKPCSAEQLLKAVNRASKLHDMLEGAEIKNIISQMDSLPSQPALYSAIMEKLQDPNSSMKEIGQIIEKDIGMSVQILKLINSSFFGFYKELTSPVQAANLLGINTIKTLVLSLEIFSLFKTDEELSALIDEIWKYSMMAGHFSKLIAREVSDNPIFIEDAFMVGFLHDIGLLILASKLPGPFSRMVRESKQEQIPICELEKKVFGATHPMIGAYLLGLWGFADDVIEAVSLYRDPDRLDTGAMSLGHILHLAVGFAHKLHFSDDDLYGFNIKNDFLNNFGYAANYDDWYQKCKQLYESGEINE